MTLTKAELDVAFRGPCEPMTCLSCGSRICVCSMHNWNRLQRDRDEAAQAGRKHPLDETYEDRLEAISALVKR